MIGLASLLSGWIKYGQIINIFAARTGATTFTTVLYLIFLYICDLYNLDRSFHKKEGLVRIFVAIATGAVASSAIFFLLHHWQYARSLLFWQALICSVLIMSWRFLYSLLFPKMSTKEDILIIGAGEAGRAIYEVLKGTTSPFRVKGFLDDDPAKLNMAIGSSFVIGTTKDLIAISNSMGIKTVILAIIHNRSFTIMRRMLDARLQGIKIIEMPTLYEQLSQRVPIHYIQDHWLLFEDGFNFLGKGYVKKFKRIVDVTASLFIFVLVAPLMAITILAIRLDSSGPIFYKQERVGERGRVFILRKFRSMCVDAEKCGAVWAQEDDPRITRVGKWIRLTRIDELPQLWNVIKGEMSLIGPRPERPEFVKELEKIIPYYYIRHTVKPGITGWAQINYRYGASVEDAIRKLEYDVYYVKNMSPAMDIEIFLKSIGVVLFGQGAR